MRIAAIICLAALLTATGGCGLVSQRNSAIVKVVKECSPSVVNISTERVVLLQQNPYWRSYGGVFDQFFNQHMANTVTAMNLKGIGSGVIVSKDGLIVTNAHVIHMANKVYVVLSDGTTCEATVPAVSATDDIALLKITPPKPLKPIRLGGDAIVGETVVSIGDPYGLENSVSAGIISGTNRTFAIPEAGLTYNSLIQTDASINLGSSGGALLNLDGELVGINLAIIQGAQSIGFAIPARTVKIILQQYRDYLKKSRGVAIPAQ